MNHIEKHCQELVAKIERDLAERLKRWREDRDAFALADGHRRYEDWLRAHRERCQAEAAQAFEESKQPPTFDQVAGIYAKQSLSGFPNAVEMLRKARGGQ